MKNTENEILERIEKKLDIVIERTIRHDEQIKSQGRVQKILIGISGSIFLIIIGLVIKIIVEK